MSDTKLIQKLLLKYNEVLKESIRVAMAEDLINLIIVNGDDKNFALVDLIKEKTRFKEAVFKEFIILNSPSIGKELREMKEKKIVLRTNKGNIPKKK